MEYITILEKILTFILSSKLFFLNLAFLFPIRTFSQTVTNSLQYKFINIGTKQDLPNSAVVDLFQDKYGFIWAATDQGLSRYDGYKFTRFPVIPEDSTSISSNRIAHGAFYEDKEENLWVATMNSGINKFNRRTEKFKRYQHNPENKNSLPDNAINCVVGDKETGLWIATLKKGLVHYNFSDSTFTNWQVSTNKKDTLMRSNTLVTLLVDSQKNLWIGTNDGVSKFKNGNFEYFRPELSPPTRLAGGFVTHIIEDNEGNIWVGTNNGLNLLKKGEKKFTRIFPGDYLPKNSGNYNYILEIFQDSEGKFWLGTLAGLVSYDYDRSSFTAYKHDPSDVFSIAKGSVYTILEDKNLNLWIGTSNGISILNKASEKLNNPDFRILQSLFQRISGEAGAVASLKANGKYWIATTNGLFSWQPKESLELILKGDFSALFEHSNGAIYAGTISEGFYKISRNGKTTHYPNEKQLEHSPDSYRGARITSFAEDGQGYIWIGSLGTLNRFDPRNEKFRQFSNNAKEANSISDATINDLFYDSKGNLWIATEKGLNKLPLEELSKPFTDTLNFKSFQYDDGNTNTISSNIVLTIHEDVDKNIWIGTDVGLNIFNYQKRTWRRLYTTHGLPQNRITNILEDKNHKIWVTTFGGGISYFTPKDSLFVNYELKDGLNSLSFGNNSCFITDDGQLFLAGTKGINFFDPTEVYNIQSSRPLFYFTAFQLFNKSASIGKEPGSLTHPIYLTSEVVLNHNHRVFSFEFTTLNFIHPDKETYRYRLLNFDETWHYLGKERKVTFSNLSPGKYILEIEISGNQKHWTPSGKSMTIHILSPWYWAWWTKSLYFILLIGAIYSFYRFQLNRQLTQAEAVRLRELNEFKTRFYTNITHEFRTPLTIILGMAETIEQAPQQWLQEGLKMIKRNGNSLLRLVNQLLDLSKIETDSLPLKMVQGDIVAFLRTLLELFHSYAESKKIEMRFESEHAQVLMDYDPDKTKDIVSNLISNALKFTPENGKTRLKVEIAENAQLLITVKDTGVGITPEKLPLIFDRFYQADNSATRQGEGTGIGLALAKELVKLLGGKIEAASEQGKGSVFSVWLPIKKTAPLLDGLPEVALLLPDTPAAEAALDKNAMDSELPLALIVEDNADVVTYLIACLKSQYRLEVAYNGQAGIDKAIEIVPDVIVSDVMMPEKDGFELCRTLKEDQRTSHIPIVLLTALGDTGSRLEGLETGADAYLAKPFNERELEISLRKSMELRQRLRERFASGIAQQDASPTIYSKEDAFIAALHKLLEQTYTNPSFTIPLMAKGMGVSETQLRRKVQALLDTTPQLYLRRFRLQKAYHLVKDSDLRFNEIAFATGFDDPAHFSNVFLQEFGLRPSDFRR